MKFYNFIPFAKYGLFLILLISLAGTASAATGGIALSWDDAMSVNPCYENIQLFQKYNATCTINVNSNDLGTYAGATTNLSALYNTYKWEVAAHGYNHEDAVAYLNNHTANEWLILEIIQNINALNVSGYPVKSFVYPLGSNNNTTDTILAPYFRTLRSSDFDTMPDENGNPGEDVNNTSAVYYKWDDNRLVYGVEIDDNTGVSLDSIKAGIDYAMENGYVLVLYGHTITSGTPAEYETSTSKLEEILNYTYQKNGTFYRLEDLGNSSWVSTSTSNVTANFTVSSTSIVMGGNVTFEDSSVNQTSELLDFGDGSTSSTASVTHTYTKPGTYNAVLTVINGASSQSMTKTITVVTGYNGGIALSWDDVGSIDPCYENIQTFQKYNATSTVNLNSLSGSSQSTKNNLSALNAAGWEIAAHGFNHADSVTFLNDHTSLELLNQEILPNIAEITNNGYPVYSFAYPYGSKNDTTDALLAPYFKTIRALVFSTDSINETGPSGAYYKWDNTRLVYAVEIDDKSNVSLESIQYGIDEAIKYGYVLVLYGHTITPNATENTLEYQTSTSKLDSILNYTYQKGGKFYNMGDLGNSSWVQPSFSNVTANFTVSKDSVAVGEDVTFVDYSVNQNSELLDFGDGTNSSNANAVHKYTTVGTYTAYLTVTNGFSTKSMTKTIIVTTGHPGGIALSWDDVSNVDQCYQDLTMFKKYNATCTMNVNKLSDCDEYIINELDELHLAGWEISAHGYTHEDPIAFLNNSTSQEWLDQEILPNIVETAGYGYPYSFAYPYGSRNETTDALLAPYFRTLRATAWIGNNNINETPEAYYKWDNAALVYGVEIDDQTGASLESIKYGIDDAIKYGYVLVLYGQTITPTVTGDYQTSTSKLDSILSYTYQNGGKFYNMGDLGNPSWVQPSIYYNVTANFYSNPTTGSAPLTVTFKDRSTGLPVPTSWSWDFGDGATSTEKNPTHTYSEAATYTVTLIASNGNSTSSKTAQIIVDEKRGSGGSSSGGGGGSPEPARNVEVKELSQVFVTNGKAIQFDFTKNATCVVSVGYDAKKTVGKITTIVEQLKSKSTLVSNLSEGQVYKYFNVWVGNSGYATSTNIENPTICFKVSKSWVQDNKIDKDSIALNRYSDKKWENLAVSLSGEDSKYLYFKADVPGYTFFAITGKANTSPEENVTEIQPDDSENSEDMENTGEEANQEPDEENTGIPGFNMVYGITGLLAVFLYKRR